MMEKTNDISKQSANLIEIKDLTVHFEMRDGIVCAVNDINLHIKKNMTLGLVGETGAGKTTTALSIMRLIQSPPGVIKNGKILFEGRDMLSFSEREMCSIRGREISMIFQDPMTALNPVFTIGEQIAEVISLHEGINHKEASERAGEMLEFVGIPRERAIDYPHQFSGGMKQRVVIAMMLSCSPKLLIADEPTTALDVTIQAQVLDMMKKLKAEKGMAMLMITHDLGIIAETCDDVAVMYAGQIVEYGTVEDVFKRTAHPYTEGLFNSLPSINQEQNMLKPINGLMPDPTDLPKGCPFAPRCQYADERCNSEKPKMYEMGDTHYSACCAYDRKDFVMDRGIKS